MKPVVLLDIMLLLKCIVTLFFFKTQMAMNARLSHIKTLPIWIWSEQIGVNIYDKKCK